jgi:predicted  nucleic acid-binding Zn-ribbon protein
MIEALLNYQTADAKLRKIEKTLADSEERKKAMSAKKYLEGVEENVNKLDVRASELMGLYEQMTDEQLKLKEQENVLKESLDSVADEKEATYLLKKAEELIGKIKSLGAKAGKIAEEIQSIMKEYSTIKNTTKAARAQYSENVEKYNALKDSVKAEKEEVEKQLETLKGKVDASLMDRYLKKRAGKIYPVLYEVRGDVCGACNMQLPMSEMNKLKNGEIIDCDQCGRLLYQKK